ncbi:MAG: Cobalt/magnesium transport protein CorA [Syntrophomonadaceae bacterium]|nr:Cobalt/magnesium transport protein CorA [Bacillota bacterium]
MLKRFHLARGEILPTEAEDSQIHIYINPDAAEREELQVSFNLDDHTLSSALDPDEVSRIEAGADSFFLIWKIPANYPDRAGSSFDVASLGLLLTRERLLIITSEEFQLSGHEALTIPELNSLFDVMLGILFRTTHDYLIQLKTIKKTAKELQDKINASLQNEHLIRMFNLSEGLVYFINAISANGAVLTRLQNYARKENLSHKVIDFIDDLIIENTQCYRLSTTYSTVFAGLMDARGNIINNNMNILIRNLTLINIVFLPLNLIASIGGMSEFTMMTEGIPWPLAYASFGIAMLSLGWLTAAFLKRAGFMGTAAAALAKNRQRNSLT